MIDKAGAIPGAVTLEALKFMGARPRQVDEKPISIQWSPSVLTSDDTTAGPLPAQYKISPWLSTDVQNVSHLGVYWYIEQLFGALEYQVELEVQFEFKKPFLANVISQTHALAATPAVKNLSRDGVVDTIAGGDDTELTH